jgi:hypothetical protein
MTSREMYRTRPRTATPTLRRWSLVAFAAGFLLLYLTADFVVANLASSTMPLPNASADVTQRWFADNPLAAVMIGVCQLLSVACLGGFAVSLRQDAATAGQVRAARKATPWGLLAVGCMALSSRPLSYSRNGMSIFVLLLYSGYAVGKVTVRFRSSMIPQ